MSVCPQKRKTHTRTYMAGVSAVKTVSEFVPSSSALPISFSLSLSLSLSPSSRLRRPTASSSSSSSPHPNIPKDERDALKSKQRSLDTTLGFSRALFSLSKLPQSPPSYHLVAARALGGASEVPGTPARARDPRLMRWSHSPPPKKTPVPQRARVQRPSPCTAKYPLLVHVPLLPGLFSAYTPPKEF